MVIIIIIIVVVSLMIPPYKLNIILTIEDLSHTL